MLRPVVARIRDLTNSHCASENTTRRCRRLVEGDLGRLPRAPPRLAKARLTAAAAAVAARIGIGIVPPQM